MNTNNHGLLLLSSFFIFSLAYFPYLAISETPCPYPCYPTPPIGGSSSTPSMTQPPPYPPPAVNYPSPAGNLPNYPPPVGNIPNYPSPPYGVSADPPSSNMGPPMVAETVVAAASMVLHRRMLSCRTSLTTTENLLTKRIKPRRLHTWRFQGN
ncbi:hypothetical protein ISN45_Aa01g015600 [Arabidopsis thaliana x Arabidopsis arenosa]|uniref:Uncharacterized protein n=1 Tax=Arabidopsis thaliana x Arabidopsis arenosa TaxID=1240361 RepID=A0A8T2CBF6_9BRAS|nr:hypothetical protein ISN45_Aa01g015600 [Arabidopsis thaliana x Arabidopsis arenosa]